MWLPSRSSLFAFIKYTQPEYFANWHHSDIIFQLQSFLQSNDQYLMLFVPPQHGKSEIISRNLPAWALGINPDLKIAIASHTASLANDMCSDVKEILSKKDYQSIFPSTQLPPPRSYQKNKANFFQVRKRKGFLKAVGVTGALTGTPVDIAIIDDPFKDRADAESEKKRKNVWEWYTDVLLTRTHNKKKVILLMTRWHHDDLAGRLLQHEPEKWKVLKYEAIKETFDNPGDLRMEGQPIWPQKHSRSDLLEAWKRNPYSFSAMHQQNPTPRGGNIVREGWFNRFDLHSLDLEELRIDFTADLADKDKERNDPSAFMAYTRIGQYFYILDYLKGRWPFSERKRKLIEFVKSWNDGRGICHIEAKSSGQSMIDVLMNETDLNVASYEPGNRSKLERLYQNIGPLETGRVCVPDGARWLAEWLDEVTRFPDAPHDESIDNLTMMIESSESRFYYS